MKCILLTVVSFLFFADGIAQSSKPNILLILTDHLGSRDLSYYGTKDLRTPNIDKLCNSGMRFDNFYANSPVCSLAEEVMKMF